MKKLALVVTLALSLFLAACTDGTAEETPSSTQSETTTTAVADSADSIAEEEAIAGEPAPTTTSPPTKVGVELALVFEYHQPYLPATNNEIELPDARLQAAKSYLDLAELVEEFEAMQASVAMSAPLLNQLDDLTNSGATSRVTDRHYRVTNSVISELSADDKQFILNNFFDVSPLVISKFDRWVELRELRDSGGVLSDADLRDLTVLFHLGFVDSEFGETNEALSTLLADGRGYTDSDARTVLRAIDSRVDQVNRTYGQLGNDGKVELITGLGSVATLHRPQLPQLINQALTVSGQYGPTPSGFSLVGDLADGDVLADFSRQGAEWVLVSGVKGADTRPATFNTGDRPLQIVSANPELSDAIENQYSELPAAEAVEDFMSRLAVIADNQGAGDPALVTVVIEGTEIWDRFPNEGRTFLRTLFNAVSSSERIRPTTPSAYLRKYPDSRGQANELTEFTSADESLWAGEPEETGAATLFNAAAAEVDEAIEANFGELTPELEQAQRMLSYAAAADFTLHYGQDSDSGDDAAYDRGFREWLGRAYDAIEIDRPLALQTSLLGSQLPVADQVATGPISITVDGNPTDWTRATLFDFTDTGDVITNLGIALDSENLALQFDGGAEFGTEIYLSLPGFTPGRTTTITGESLGFGATHMILWNDIDGACLAETLPPASEVGTYPAGCRNLESALSVAGVEMLVPLELVGPLATGQEVPIRMKTGSSVGPQAGPAIFKVHELS